MSKLITQIKRLALALCFVTPLVSWATVDYTDTIYEPWSYSAGCVVWRGTQNDFHQSTIADVTADGTVGEAYTLNTSGHPWQVFASNQSAYTSPGLTLVFDESGYKANPDASFTPLSFGGLKVDALADETEGTPYSITGTGTRYTDFGRTDVATYFEFNKSFTVNRSSATRCYGAVTIQVAQGATFKSQASLWAEVGGTVKLTGEGTVELPSGLYVNDNSTSTLDLSAATRPTITGNVTIYEGGAIALPAGTEPSEETPFTVCSGTLAVGANYNYVKIGDADPITATLTVSGGAITGIEPYALERTFTSDYPTVVPAGAVFTFQGGTEDEPVTINSLSVAGTLKLEGYFNFPNNYNPGDNAELDVVSGSVTVTRGSTNWVKGTIKIREDATFVNAQTDALNYGGTVNVHVWGTLDMGATRWSLGSNNTINLYEGCTVKGSGQGDNGALDWIENATANLNVTGAVTIDAPIKIRGTATVNVTVDADASSGLTLGTTIGVGTIVKKGAGLIKFTTNPDYAITCQNGAFTFGVNATPTITYTAKPSSSTSLWYAKQATWKGTVVIPAIAAGNTSTQILLENWGNDNSSLTLNGISGNTWLTSNVNVPAAVTVAGNVGFSNGSKGSTYTFSKIAGGTGNLTFQAWANNANAKYAITELDADNYSGTITIPSSNASQMTVKLGNIVKTGAEAGAKLVAISNGGGTFDISTATLNGEAADLEVRSDGIYVAVPVTTVDITIPEVDNATVSVTADGVAVTPENGVVTVDIGAAVVVTYTAAEGYTIANGTIEFTATAETTAVDTTGVTAKAHVAWIYDENSALVGSSPYTDELTAVQDFLQYSVGESVRFLAQSTYHDMLLPVCTYDEETFTYTRKPAEPTVATITIGGQVYEYPTLAAAIADGQNATIVLVDDIDLTGENENITIPATKIDAAFVTTIDLNGHSIAGDNDGDITVLGTLTLKDTVANSEGRIYSTTDYGTGHKTGLVLVQDSGVFNMESGAIYAVRETPVDNGQYAIITKGNARVNISGGTITAGWYVVGANNLDGVALTVNITGGTLVSTTDYALYVVGNMTVNISGTAAVSGAAGMASVRKGSLTISGGTFATSGDGDVGSWTDGTATLNPTKALINLAADYAVSSVAISGGSFTAGAQADCIVVGAKAKAGSTASVTGGSFSSNPSSFVAFGYKATETAGTWTVAKQPTTPPETPQVIDVDTTKEPEQQQADADAIAQDTVVTTPNADVAAAVSAETYDGYFTKTAVKVNEQWTVQTALNEDVVFPTEESDDLTADLADVLDVAAGADVEIKTAKPGLYYSIEAAENVGFTSGNVEGVRELATTTTVSPAKPAKTGDAVFFRVKVSTTQE